MTNTPPSPRTPLFQPTGIAVVAGQVIALLAWANVVATNITATLQLRPTNGSAPVPIVIQVTTTSNRAVSIGTATVGDDGVIDSAFCTQGTPAIPQRGQCYVQCAEQGGLGQVFFADYVYAGHGPVLGRIVDPGPAGGPGMMVRTTLAQPAAGVDYASLAIASGTIYKLRGFFGTLVTGAGVANREFAIIYQSQTPTNWGGVVASEIQTASLTVDYFGTGGSPTGSGTSASLAGGAIGIGLGDVPVFNLTGTDTNQIGFKTYNIAAADQWSVGALETEQWVMPN